MTSLVCPDPASSSTSRDTSFALGAAPARPAALPAARLATRVPCPRPSPGELFDDWVRTTSSTIRPATSGVFGSMPESTIAIVGAGLPATASQSLGSPAAEGHSCELQTPPCSNGLTGEVGSATANADPSALVAVTIARKVDPTSSSTTVYVAASARAMSTQPPVVQRRHWYESDTGEPAVHSPSETVRVLPSVGSPVITGEASGVGGTGGGGGGSTRAGGAVTASVSEAVESQAPNASVAVTTTRTSDPAAPDGIVNVAADSFPSTAVPSTVGAATRIGPPKALPRSRVSGVIARIEERCESARIWPPVSSAETPLMIPKRRPTPFASPGLPAIASATAAATSGLRTPWPWTITWKVRLGSALAAAARPGGTSAVCTVAPAGTATSRDAAATRASRHQVCVERRALGNAAEVWSIH